jgi:hypothetical protein
MYYPPGNSNNNSSFHNQPTQQGNFSRAGQFGPPPPRPPSTPPSQNPYPKHVPLLLALAYAAFWIFVFIASANTLNAGAMFLGSLGISLFWGILAYVLILDWRGSISLGGLIRWSNIQKEKRIVPGCLCVLCFPLLLGVYLIRAAFIYRPSLIMPATTPSRRQRIGAIVGSLVALGALLMYTTGNASGAGLSSSTTIAQSTQIVSTQVPQETHVTTTQILNRTTTTTTTKPAVAPTPTPIPPTPLPTQPPVPTPTLVPTQPPVPTPTTAKTGVKGNPWGYDFSPGNLIYNPPADFCTAGYFTCIPSFWQSTNGYVDECQDGMYSHSGGRPGACSHHGGEMRPLYSH